MGPVRIAISHAWLAVCALLAGVAALPARADTQLAILTPTGEASRAVRTWVDASLREAARSFEGVTVQDARETEGHVVSLEDLGLACRRDDVKCLVKLGIVAGVDAVLFPVVSEGAGDADDEVSVEVDFINISSADRTSTVMGVLIENDLPSARALLARLLTRDEAPDHSSSFDDTALPPPPTQSSEPTTPIAWGAITLGVGAAVTAVALPTAIVSDLLFAQVIPGASAQTRNDVLRPLGIAMWLGSVAGGATLAVGGVLLAQESDTSDPGL